MDVSNQIRSLISYVADASADERHYALIILASFVEEDGGLDAQRAFALTLARCVGDEYSFVRSLAAEYLTGSAKVLKREGSMEQLLQKLQERALEQYAIETDRQVKRRLGRVLRVLGVHSWRSNLPSSPTVILLTTALTELIAA